jgi:ABC-type Fe3+-hydroxamate transport system substrate-binding protein
MPSFTDQTGRAVQLDHYPKRIISTVPSQTELLAYLGFDVEVVGITAYCVHPKAWLASKTVIGGTKDLNLKLIRELKPDLILANKEENIKEQIEELAQEFPVWLSDVETFEQGVGMIRKVGALCSKAKQANDLADEIEAKRNALKPLAPLKTLYFIWKEPYMVAGKGTYIGNLVSLLGLENIAPKNDQRYPQIAFDQLKDYEPDVILLTSEPYSFTTKDLHEMGEIFPNAIIKIVDGEMFSWYGSRMRLAVDYLEKFCRELRNINRRDSYSK